MGRLRFLLVALLAATMMFAVAGPAGAQTVTEFDDDFPGIEFEDDFPTTGFEDDDDLLEDFNPLEDFDPLEDDDDDLDDDDDGDDD